MGASDAYIGYIAMAATLCMAMQFPAPLFWERLRTRKSLILGLGVFSELLTYIGLPCAVVLPVSTTWKLALFMILTLLTGCLNQFCLPARNAWTMQCIPFSKRVSYTSLTSMINTVVNVISVFLAGLFLDTMEAQELSIGTISPAMTAILILRALACALAVASTLILAIRVKESAYQAETSPTVNLSMLLLPLKNKRFFSIVLIPCLWAMASGIIGNYFTLHIIDNVHLSYTVISSASLISTPMILLVTPIWTKLLRRCNWLPTLAWAMLGYCLAYFCNVLISENSTYFYFIAIIVGHLFQPGVTMITSNLIYVYMPEESRTAYFSFYSLLTTAFTLLGQGIGTLFVSMTVSVRFTLFGIPICNLQLVSALAAGVGIVLACTIFARKNSIRSDISVQ